MKKKLILLSLTLSLIGGANISNANLTLRMDSELKEQASELFKAK